MIEAYRNLPRRPRATAMDHWKEAGVAIFKAVILPLAGIGVFAWVVAWMSGFGIFAIMAAVAGLVAVLAIWKFKPICRLLFDAEMPPWDCSCDVCARERRRPSVQLTHWRGRIFGDSR